MYLENVFNSEDIKKKMKEDSAKFEVVDKYFLKECKRAQAQRVHILCQKTEK